MSQDYRVMLGDDSQRVSNQGRILYLEGKTDPEYFFALLGVDRPADSVHQDVLVKGLSDNQGSGSAAVRDVLKISATQSSLAKRVYGIIDGDGAPTEPDRGAFTSAGPLLIWPYFCIESLFYGTGWPAAWGPAPNWTQDLQPYAPYVAVNRLQRETKDALRELGINRYINPGWQQPLKTIESVMQELHAQEHRIADLQQVPQRFERYAAEFMATLDRSVDEALVYLNGKWFFQDFVPRRTRLREEACQRGWMDHARHHGGHPQVRALWQRITGRDPLMTHSPGQGARP